MQGIAVLEDCPLTLLLWKRMLNDRANYFSSPHAFFETVNSEQSLYSHIITDFYFDNDTETGLDVAEHAKMKWPNCEVILVTNDSSQGEHSAFSRVIDKQKISEFRI